MGSPLDTLRGPQGASYSHSQHIKTLSCFTIERIAEQLASRPNQLDQRCDQPISGGHGQYCEAFLCLLTPCLWAVPRKLQIFEITAVVGIYKRLLDVLFVVFLAVICLEIRNQTFYIWFC